VQGNNLRIEIPEWLSGMLRIEEGDLVSIDNANGKFNIRPVNARPIH
jgi:antitoxin component of MazEF toxin-antitoxin module